MARGSDIDQDFAASRKRKSDGQKEGNERPSKRKQKFSSLNPHTRHISQELVRAEWKSLPKPAQQQVRDIFLAAKRTTLNQVLEGSRRREAEFAVNDVLRRLEKQLPRMPFPPNTKIAHLDLDGVLEQVRMLEAEKTPLNDSLKLLEEEIELEEQRVEMKRKELARLERESKAASKVRKQRGTKMHPLMNENKLKSSAADSPKSIGLVSKPEASSLNLDDQDEGFEALLSQLQDHFHSIRSNTQPLEQIELEMLRTRSVLAASHVSRIVQDRLRTGQRV